MEDPYEIINRSIGERVKIRTVTGPDIEGTLIAADDAGNVVVADVVTPDRGATVVPLRILRGESVKHIAKITP